MSDTRRYPSYPPLTLAVDLTSIGTNIRTTSSDDWNGDAISASYFNTDYVPCTLMNDARTKVEFILLTAADIANLTTTGCTIYKRGLKYYAEGNSTDYDEVASHKLSWTAGETKLLIGTNPPLLYAEFPSRGNDETITKTWTFTNPYYPQMDSATPAPTLDAQLATKKYVDDIAIAGAPNATTVLQGLVQVATQSDVNNGTDVGSTTASLEVRPKELAVAVQNATYTYGTDASGTDSYAITLTPVPPVYALGQMFTFKAGTANTGAATLAVNGQAAITIKKNHDQDLETGDIEAGGIYTVIYDGTNFQLQTQQSSMPSTVDLTNVTTAYTDGTLLTSPNFTYKGTITAGDLLKVVNDSGVAKVDKIYGMSSASNVVVTPAGVETKMRVVKIDTNTLLFGWINTTGDDSIRIQIGTVSSGTLTMQDSAKTVSSSGGAGWAVKNFDIDVCSSTVGIIVLTSGNGVNGRFDMYPFAIAANVITVGTVATPSTGGDTYSKCAVTHINSTDFTAFWNAGSNVNVIHGAISGGAGGSIATAGTNTVYTGVGTIDFTESIFAETSKVIVAYSDSNDTLVRYSGVYWTGAAYNMTETVSAKKFNTGIASFYVRTADAGVAGFYDSVSVLYNIERVSVPAGAGTLVTINSSQAETVSNPTSAVIFPYNETVYLVNSNGSKAEYSEWKFVTSEYVLQRSITDLSTNLPFTNNKSLTDYDSFLFGYVSGSDNKFNITDFGWTDFIGIAKNSGVASDVKPVTVFGDVYSSFSSLVYNAKVYIDPSGSLTQRPITTGTFVNLEIGKAVSDTTVIIEI